MLKGGILRVNPYRMLHVSISYAAYDFQDQISLSRWQAIFHVAGAAACRTLLLCF